MSFRLWLEANSAPLNPQNKQPTLFNPAGQNQRGNNYVQNKDARVQYGKRIEDRIYQGLEKCGLKLRKPTGEEDMRSKVDGWWDNGSSEEPVQIKYRDSGNDILFEVMKDFGRRIPGRDMTGIAKYYAILSKDGKMIRLVSVESCKSIINAMMKGLQQNGFDQYDSFKMAVPGGEAVLKRRSDPRHEALRQQELAAGRKPGANLSAQKLMAYIPVSAVPVVMECPASISFA